MRNWRYVVGIIAGIISLAGMQALAQSQAPQIFVYPQKGQSKDQQAKDDAACRQWAREQSGVDPNAPQKQEQLGDNTRGTVGGAARGAAVGAAVGAIAGDAGKGAGAGAVVGGVAGRRRQKAARQAGEQQTQMTFLRAFAACMEGRGYTVK